VVDLVHTDAVFRVEPNTTPDYNSGNSLVKLLDILESSSLGADREVYEPTSLQYVFPLTWLQLYGPSAPNTDQLDPTKQDVKTDFQKQNVRDFHLGDVQAVRGWANTGDWRGPFLRLSYRAGPDSALAQAGARLSESIGCRIAIPNGPSATVPAHYDTASARYAVELWGRNQDQLRSALGPRGQASVDQGALVGRPDLVRGGGGDFTREAMTEKDIRTIAPDHAMHPIVPFYLDVTFTQDPDGSGPSDGPTRVGFEMRLRGWDNYLRVGTSPNPHGGVGFLEYRNLFSDYYNAAGEIDRRLEPWNFDAFGHKGHASGDVEPFMAVNYMDLHVLESACGIGLHRHRDNQEIFMMIDGEGLMVVGDWADSHSRARSFEIRHLAAGELVLLKGGNLHGLMNPLARRSSLFMFGGYD
jgi:mannose-6-phosphate isomerase-like protein (cupin superfamily)